MHLIIIAFIIHVYAAYRHGDINNTLVPTDSSGLRCGHDSEVIDQPHLMFFDILKCIDDPLVPIYGCPTTQVCVSQCPNASFEYQPFLCNPKTIAQIKESLICTRDVVVANISTCAQLNALVASDKCADSYWPSTSCKRIDPKKLLYV